MDTYDPHKNTTEVRQGNRRTMSLRVLLISVFVLIIAFAFLWIFYSMSQQGNVIS